MDITLKLKIKDVEIELSREDAKKLKEALDELVGTKTIEHHHHDWDWRPYRYPWIWTTPSITYTTGDPAPNHTVYCANLTNDISLEARVLDAVQTSL
jgi:hypothetical protein